MKYVSIDLETTGLDPLECQIIEFAAVLDDTSKPLEEAEAFQCYVKHDIYQGEPFALHMNREIFHILATRTGRIIPIRALHLEFTNWLGLLEACDSDGKITASGKNFSTFDLPFLIESGHWWKNIFHRRVLDPASMYATPDDEKLPGTEECLKRAGINETVSHNALEDALQVCKLIRKAWKC